ncbi:hypothetical protein [Burkholderia oklahomensis]|uniref:ATP--cob(I)alamin adenosyltransferase n=1 Tax=Burkholderia oklahomensis TaxID=342113 RepID=A0AAI8BBX4_9BURK|nr:hypothetical protein [Burkholderia oklahomensis]AIO69276.1 hypothetical protein DM82_4138 [Burkholderia oklahomensis]AJX34940.1 hypothetical protein BG90_3888 [Burkholderia oklahomensis C6786]AOI40301.1 hypothetical protein WG70_12180 [Burkholderia oklahomensis EO147]AOI49921.1 hypothetical protein WI23_29940 [Burkholderia oklahomensis C6786]KUY53160.1 hypothetical protein WI23_23510 [Burkholderia oklahomensis C6786]
MNLDPQDFVVHDVSRFPMCVFRASAATPGYAPQWEKEIDALMRQGAPFVIVYVSLEADESHDDRKHRAIWLKQNKAELGAVCQALISVEPDPARRAAVAEQGKTAVKAFGIPHEAVASLDEATALAARLTRLSDTAGVAKHARQT